MDELSKILNKNDVGLYRDDGLIVLKHKNLLYDNEEEEFSIWRNKVEKS